MPSAKMIRAFGRRRRICAQNLPETQSSRNALYGEKSGLSDWIMYAVKECFAANDTAAENAPRPVRIAHAVHGGGRSRKQIHAILRMGVDDVILQRPDGTHGIVSRAHHQIGRIQIDAKAEEQKKERGQHTGHKIGGRIADDLAKFCRMMLGEGKGLFRSETMELFFRNQAPQGMTARSLGWNLDKTGIPRGFSSATIFHTGWTGQSMWIDPETGRFLLVLTNRFGESSPESCKGRLAIAAEALDTIS